MRARWVVGGVAAAISGGLGVLVMPPVLMVMSLTAATEGDGTSRSCVVEAAPTGEATALPDPAQRANAKTIIEVGQRLKIPERGWVVAIATAKVESNLINVNYGDRDSLGLFQQRTGGWGSKSQRTDPETAAEMFYTGGKLGAPGLLDIAGWQLKPIGAAAQAVQVSAFPDRYGQQEGLARKIVEQVAGASEPAPTCKPEPEAATVKPGQFPLTNLAEIEKASNGQIPVSLLPSVPWANGHHLRPDALNDLVPLNAAYRERFGRDICMTDSYRTLAQQQRLYVAKPGLAAVPGTSNHGLARALDLCGGIQNFDSPEHIWLAAHGPRYGWRNPSWAVRGGSRPEPWHFSWRTDN